MKGGGGVAILFIIAERASSTIRLSSPPLLEALLHLARVAKVWANAPSPHGWSPHDFSRMPSRAHAHALPTPSPGRGTRNRRTDPREIPIPAPPAIRTSVTDNSVVAPSSLVRALSAPELRRGVARPHRLRGQRQGGVGSYNYVYVCIAVHAMGGSALLVRFRCM